MSGLGMVGVIGASVPTSLAIIDSETTSSMNEAISKVTDDAYTSFSENLESLTDKLETEYKKVFNDAESHLQDSQSKLTSEYTGGIEQAKGYYTLASGLADHANYYLFEMEPFVKQFLSYFPIIIEESIFESLKTEEDTEEFLSFKKLTAIIISEGMKNAFEDVAKLSEKYHDKLNAMNGSDVHGLMSIIKELKNENKDIEEWLNKLKENAKAINNSNGENYCNATKLLTHLLIGKNTVDGIGEKVTRVKGTIDALRKLKTLLTGIKGEELTKFENTINALETRTSQSQWVDPCSNSSDSQP